MKIKNFYKHYKYLFGDGISLWQKYKLHRRKRYEPFQLNFFGKKIQIPDAGSFLGVYQELFIEDNYLFRTDSVKPLIIDCGANIGLSVIYFKKLYPMSKIIAFEADAEICKILSENVDVFGLKDVDIHAKAVWTSNGQIEFRKEGGASGMIAGKDENTIKIPSVRLKDILEQYADIDFLKIDIEGAEYEVLKDCKDEISRAKYLFIEYHSFKDEEQNLGEILNILKNAGFRYHLTEAFASNHPFVERKIMLGMDLLINIYAYK